MPYYQSFFRSLIRISLLLLPFGTLCAAITPVFPILPPAVVGNFYLADFTTDQPAGNGINWRFIDVATGNPLSISGFTLDVTGGRIAANSVPISETGNKYDIRVEVRDDANNLLEQRTYYLVIITATQAACPEFQDFTLVLDASGSMRATDAGTRGNQERWANMIETLENYLPSLAFFLDDDDNLDAIFYRNNTATPTFDGRFGQISGSIGTWIANNIVGGMTPGGNTPMGTGVLAGKNTLGTTHGRNLIVLTDGRENGALLFDLSNRTYTDGTTTLDLDGADKEIRVFTIGIGNSANHILEQLANPPDEALFAHTSEPTELNFLFASIVPASLQGCSPRIVDYRFERMPVGAPVTQAFLVDSLVEKLVIDIRMQTEDARFDKKVQLFKDGNPMPYDPEWTGRHVRYEINLPARQEDGTYLDGGGRWEVRFSGTPDAAYEINAMVEDNYLRSTAGFLDPTGLNAGDDIEVFTTLSAAGVPIETGVTVTARLFRPGENLYDLAASQSVDPSLLTVRETSNLPNINGSFDTAQAKIEYLLADPEFVARLAPQIQSLTLTHQSNGRYAGTFPGNLNTVSGTYRVMIDATGNVPGFGDFEHLDSKWILLDFGAADDIDPQVNRTLVNVVSTPDGNHYHYRLTITPVNQYGTRLGPGQADRIRAILGNGELVLNDQLDGSYTASFTVSQGSEPDLTIYVADQDEPVYQKSVRPRLAGFGVSLHGGYLGSLNATAPLTTATNGNFAELDLSYRLGGGFALELRGGYYRYENDFSLSGGSLQLEYTFGRAIRGLHPRLAAGAGLFKPDNQDLTLALALRGGLAYRINPNLEIGLDLGAYLLPSPDYQLSYAGLGIRYFL